MEARQAAGYEYVIPEIVPFQNLRPQSLGQLAHVLWPAEKWSPQVLFYHNSLPEQFSWWGVVFYNKRSSEPQNVPSVELQTISDASVVGQTGVVRLKTGEVLDLWLEHAKLDTPGGRAFRFPDGRVGVQPGGDTDAVSGEFFHGRVGGDYNYAHWLTCALPLWVHFAQNCAKLGMKLVVGPKLTRFHADALELLGVQPQDIFEMPDSEVRFERLVVGTPNSLWNPPRLLSAATRIVANIAKTQAPTNPPPPGNRRLFLSRADTNSRNLLNEEKVLHRLAPLGFEKTLCSELSFRDQVRLFSEADIVIGVHGAAMTNIAFCSPGARVVELFPEYCVQPEFRDLAIMSGLNYGYVVGTSFEVARSRVENSSWSQPFVISEQAVFDAAETAVRLAPEQSTT